MMSKQHTFHTHAINTMDADDQCYSCSLNW